jgi:hypothetical protein
MSTTLDNKLAGLAAGFTLGFGVLTVWEAIKQTRSVKSPLRSHYIWMVWGEICGDWYYRMAASGRHSTSNVYHLRALDISCMVLTINSVPVLFMGLFCWVWEIQLLMQIIINRTAVIVDDRRLMAKIKVCSHKYSYAKYLHLLTKL